MAALQRDGHNPRGDEQLVRRRQHHEVVVQIYNGPSFTGAVDIPKSVWFHLRLEVVGAHAKLYVKDIDKPALVMSDLKSGGQKGQVGMLVLMGEAYFSNFEMRTTPDAPWKHSLPPMPSGILTKWSLSPAYDALARNKEGRNELVLAVSEVGGGWGFICRLEDYSDN